MFFLPGRQDRVFGLYPYLPHSLTHLLQHYFEQGYFRNVL